MDGRETPRDRMMISRRRFIQGTIAAGAAMNALSSANPDAGARQTISLNGIWKLYFDRQGRWIKKDWIADFLSANPQPVQIPWGEMRASMEPEAIDFPVPATWEEYRPNTVGEGWYWREVAVPEAEFPRSVRLVFHAVRYGAEVFWDGRRVALYLGGYTPFTVDLTSLAKPGTRHQVAVHVVNPGGGEAGNWEKLFFENIQIPQSHNFGGIWQPVDLIVTSPVFIADIFVEPQISRKAALAHLTIRNLTAQTQNLTLDARALSLRTPDQVAGKAREILQVPGQQKLSVTLRLGLDPLVLWEPANPARYRLEVNLRGSSPVLQDDHTATFGMREFTVEGRFFHLNGRKFMVKSTINHQYYPVTVGYPPTSEFARKEVDVALRSGLNMMHVHRQIGHPQLMEWADEMGLLLYQEPGGVIFDDREHLDYPGIQLLLRQLADLVVRDRNHPALVAWGMANENSLDPNVEARMMQTTRDFDPTRVVCDNSGHGHRLFLPYENTATPWRDLHYYPIAPLPASTYRLMNQFGRAPDYAFRRENGIEAPSRMPQVGPQIVGEFGYGGLPDMPAAVREFHATGKLSVERANWEHSLQNLEAGFKKYDLAPVFGTISEFCRYTEELHAEQQAEMIQALRTNPFNSGFAVSCYHDLAIWYCGITDLFRNPKLLSQRLAQVNVPLFPALEADRSPAWTDQKTTIRCVLVNEDVLRGPAKLSLSITGPAGEKVLAETRALNLSPQEDYVATIFEMPITLGGSSGPYAIRAVVEGGDGRTAVNERRVFAQNPQDIQWPSPPVLIYDPSQYIFPSFARRDIPYQMWSPEVEASGRTILVGEIQKWFYFEQREKILKEFHMILDQCRAGAKVAFLIDVSDGGLIDLINELGIHAGPLRMVESSGTFQGDFHYVKPHPIFAGLLTKTVMGQAYRNVIARHSLDGFEGETVAGCNENAYCWGSDLGVIRIGSGAAVLCTMRLSQNLGVEPVAERIVSNLAGWKIGG